MYLWLELYAEHWMAQPSAMEQNKFFAFPSLLLNKCLSWEWCHSQLWPLTFECQKFHIKWKAAHDKSISIELIRITQSSVQISAKPKQRPRDAFDLDLLETVGQSRSHACMEKWWIRVNNRIRVLITVKPQIFIWYRGQGYLLVCFWASFSVGPGMTSCTCTSGISPGSVPCKEHKLANLSSNWFDD